MTLFMRYRNLCSLFLWTTPAALQTLCGSGLLCHGKLAVESLIFHSVSNSKNFVRDLVYFSCLFLNDVIATQLNCRY